MARQLLRSKRPLLSVARSNIEIAATVGAMAVAAAVAPPMTRGHHVTAARVATPATAAFSRTSSIPSHNGVYRASLVPLPEVRHGRDGDVWTVEVRAANGDPVADATLALESWMPDHERMGATAARVTGSLGDGRYRVEGLRLDRRGWWNVRLVVAASAGTDSLAFNMVRGRGAARVSP